MAYLNLAQEEHQALRTKINAQIAQIRGTWLPKQKLQRAIAFIDSADLAQFAYSSQESAVYRIADVIGCMPVGARLDLVKRYIASETPKALKLKEPRGVLRYLKDIFDTLPRKVLVPTIRDLLVNPLLRVEDESKCMEPYCAVFTGLTELMERVPVKQRPGLVIEFLSGEIAKTALAEVRDTKRSYLLGSELMEHLRPQDREPVLKAVYESWRQSDWPYAQIILAEFDGLLGARRPIVVRGVDASGCDFFGRFTKFDPTVLVIQTSRLSGTPETVLRNMPADGRYYENMNRFQAAIDQAALSSDLPQPQRDVLKTEAEKFADKLAHC